MKPGRFLSFVLLPLMLGCAREETVVVTPPPKVAKADPVAAPVAVTAVQPAVVTTPTVVQQAPPNDPGAAQAAPIQAPIQAAAVIDLPASDTWNAIKDDTYDQRGDFSTGLEHIAARLDSAIQVLDAKRTTLPETSVQDWDFAMKELDEARTNLRYQLTELNKATPDTWNEAKDRVAGAWQRVRDDYDKVKLSTTI